MHRPSNDWIPVLAVFALLLAGCVTAPSQYDYTALENSRPRSILVIPPVNNSVEVNGSYAFLSTISRPLAEKGYYVFPVAVIDHFLKENGLPTPAEMNVIPLDKIEEHIGADAVLYVSIEDWGQKYQVLTSTTVVHSTLRLVDVKTGDLLWETTVKATRSSDDGDLGLLGAIVIALATQVSGSISDNTPQLSSFANHSAIHNKSNGLLHGPYFNPDGEAKWDTTKAHKSAADEDNLLFMGKAAGEIAAKSYDEKLWAKALVMAEGDEQKRKGIYVRLRSKQLATEQKKGKEASAIANPGQIPKISGTYISEIKNDARNWYFKTGKQRRMKLTFTQDGDKITAVNSAYDLKIIGTREDEYITFYALPSQIASYEITGKWKLDADSARMEGSWEVKHHDLSGEWNLRRID